MKSDFMHLSLPINDLLIDTLCYQFSYDFDVQSDFGKLFNTKKTGPV